MKKHLIILIISTCVYAQKHDLPQVEFNTIKVKTSKFYKQLGINDKKSLIVTAGNTRQFYDGSQNFLVYSNDGPVRKFTIDGKTNSVQEIFITIEQSEYYWQFLYTCLKDDTQQIDQQQFYGIKNNIIILDGSSDYFTIYQNKQSLDLNSYGSQAQITAKTTGWEQRQKLLDLIKKFDDAFNQ